MIKIINMNSSIKKTIQRDIYIEKYRKKINDSYQKLPNKVQLTKAQEAEIQNYWKDLLGYKIPTDWHRYFYARTGVFSKKYIPRISSSLSCLR